MAPPHAESERGTPLAILAAAFLFNLGQGVLRPSMPLYLQRAFGANYRMVTLIPAVFGTGKWAASLPTGYLLDRLGRPLMIWGLLLIALVDVASVLTSTYPVFLGLRAVGGAGWAMFATVATTSMVRTPAARRRGRAVSLLLASETLGLLVGTAAGGWLYQGLSEASPFVFEAACMIVASLALVRWARDGVDGPSPVSPARPPRALSLVLSTPGVPAATATSAILVAIQTGVLVFLLPLYLADRGGVGPGAVGTIVSLGVLGRFLALWLGGGLSDRWGRERVLMPGLLVYAALLGALVVVSHPLGLGVFSLAVGAVAGVIAPVPTALVGDLVPPALQGVAIGWLRTAADAGQVVGPLVMGAAADALDLAAPFLLGAALLVATAWPWWRHVREASRR